MNGVLTGCLRRLMAQNAPVSHRAAKHGRAVGPLLACALALGLGLSLAQGQPIPDTILLPDSLGPLRPGYHVAFGSSTNNIYVASESSDIIIVDGESFQRIKRINTGTRVGGALLVSQHYRLYCSYPLQGRIGVIDCATNSIVRTIGVGTRPTLLCYSSGSDKLYCGDTIDNSVSVIDCPADTVLAVIPVGESLTAIVYDPTTDKVYAATEDAVLAIDCSDDSIVASLDDVREAKGLLVNRRRQKLYAVGARLWGPDTVFVISTPTDSVTAKMWLPYGDVLLPRLACNEATERLYCLLDQGGDAWHIVEFDCSGDTFTRDRYMGSSWAKALVCDTTRNRLYYLFVADDRGLLYGLDCATLDVFSGTRVQDYAVVLESDPARCRVLCAGGWRGGVLSVFDCNRDSLEEIGVVPLYGRQQFSVPSFNPVAGKLYYRWGVGWVGGVGVVDQHANRVIAQVTVPQKYESRDMAYSPTSNRLYCEVGSGLAVLDGTGDSLSGFVGLGHSGAHPLWFLDSNKLYCFVNTGTRWYVAVVDCYTDSVIREIDVYDRIDKFDLLDKSHLLCVQRHGLTLIDCRSDSVLIDTAIPGNMYAVAHTGDGKKVYIVHHYTYDRLEVLDAGSLSLLATVDWDYGGAGANPFLVLSDSTDKLYWFARDKHGTEQDSVLVVDTRSDTVIARLQAGFRQKRGCLDRTGRYIFCTSAGDSSLVIYDTQSDRVVAVYGTPPDPYAVVPNPELGCIYVGFPDVILVYPDTPPGVCEQPATHAPPKLPPQTIVRDILLLPEATSLMDINGRKVKDLKAGANDVRLLAPGVYFLRGPKAEDGRPDAAVHKVVITR